MSEQADITITVPGELLTREHYDRVIGLPRLGEPGAHACPVEGCAISSEEHHRISFGYMNELMTLRRRVAQLEGK
jgi:hypothetical protein